MIKQDKMIYVCLANEEIDCLITSDKGGLEIIQNLLPKKFISELNEEKTEIRIKAPKQSMDFSFLEVTYLDIDNKEHKTYDIESIPLNSELIKIVTFPSGFINLYITVKDLDEEKQLFIRIFRDVDTDVKKLKDIMKKVKVTCQA